MNRKVMLGQTLKSHFCRGLFSRNLSIGSNDLLQRFTSSRSYHQVSEIERACKMSEKALASDLPSSLDVAGSTTAAEVLTDKLPVIMNPMEQFAILPTNIPLVTNLDLAFACTVGTILLMHHLGVSKPMLVINGGKENIDVK